jgi:TonB family protein
MTWTKENMFEPSGCLTREAFDALVNGTLTAGDKALANEHLESCPFCTDALEGFEQHKMPERSFSEIMTSSDEAFDKMMANRKSNPDKKRFIWLSVSVAASLLLIVGLFVIVDRPQTKMQVSETMIKDSTAIKPEEKTDKAEEKKPLNETQPVSNSRKNRSNRVQNSVRFTPPEVVSGSDDISNETIAANELKKEEPKSEPATSIPIQEKEKAGAPVAAKSESTDGAFDKKTSDENESRSYKSASQLKKGVTYKDAEPIAFMEQQPEYPGGQSALSAFLNKNLQYPKQASEMSITGRVFIRFMVEADGIISNIKVIRGIGGGCDEEAVRVIKLMPKWIPGKQNGQPVKSYFTLPIVFNSQSK